MTMRGWCVLWVLSSIVVGGHAAADWPMQRQNPRRTALASGHSGLESPAVAWRYYLGGQVEGDDMLAADLDGDGVKELVFVSGGRIVVKRPDDRLVWESPSLALYELTGVVDLDGDGTLEVVGAGSPGRVVVLRGSDGFLEWRTDPTKFGPTVHARLGDLDGDESPDLYVSDVACGSAYNKGDTAFAYEFTDGFGTGIADATTERYQLERMRDYNCGTNDVLVDLDGDGAQEIVAFGTRYAYVFDGRTGLKRDSGVAEARGGYSVGLTIPYGRTAFYPSDVDGDGAEDLVGLANNNYAPSMNSRGILVLGWDAERETADRLYVRWVRSVADLETDRHFFVPEGIVDLDGDDRPEIVSSLREGGVMTTYVFNAATGEVRASIANSAISSVVDTGTGLPVVILTHTGMYEAYRFPTFTSPAPFATHTDGTALRHVPLGDVVRTAPITLPATVPLEGGERAVLVRNGQILKLLRFDESSIETVATLELDEGLGVDAIAEQTGVAGDGPGLLFSRSDGFLLVLDDHLNVLNRGGFEFDQPGVRVGGYYSGETDLGGDPAVAGPFGGDHDDVIVRDSRGVLLRLDPSEASFEDGPVVAWQVAGPRYPLLVDLDGDDVTEIVARFGAQRIDVYDATGERLDSSTPLTGGESMSWDIVPFHEGSTLRLGVVLLDSDNGNGSVAAYDTALEQLWESTPILVAGSGQGGITVDDANADGTDDFVAAVSSPTRIFDGLDGSLEATIGNQYSRVPIVTRGLAAPIDYVMGAGANPTIGVSSEGYSLTQEWQITNPEGEDPFRSNGCLAAIVECPDGWVFTSAQAESHHIVIVDVANGGNRRDRYLSGGVLAETPDAAMFPGIAGNATATARLFGDRAAVLYGSTDGYLYAIDPCAATLIWSINLRAKVGEAIFADTDGDGEEEIVVSAADGFLYGIDTEAIAAPEYVWDTDGDDSADVDETHGPQLEAVWAAVEGASGYEYAVYAENGTSVSRGEDERDPFIRTTETHMTFGERLDLGERYLVVVRSLSDDGTSREASSDGTQYLADRRPDAGVTVDAGRPDASGDDSGLDSGAGGDDDDDDDSGCGCDIPGRSRGTPWVLCLLLLMVLPRRRRSR